jgi:hypothetical protein
MRLRFLALAFLLASAPLVADDVLYANAGHLAPASTFSPEAPGILSGHFADSEAGANDTIERFGTPHCDNSHTRLKHPRPVRDGSPGAAGGSRLKFCL